MSGAPKATRPLEETLAKSLGEDKPPRPEPLTLPLHLAGHELGPFRLLRVLGSGAMGVVYLAEDVALGREVAIKLMPRGSADTDRHRRERFMHEARTAAKLVHPNVVQIFQVGEAQGMPYIAMEYVDGLTAEEAAKRAGGRLPEHTVMERLRDAADALVMAESLGICHRDIKPSNILLSITGALKIADFGLASRVTTGESIESGKRFHLEGTPFYMSPEQWSGEQVTPLADIYSLGCTFYHLLVGCTPYPARDLVGCFNAHCTGTVPDARALVPGVDADLAELLMRCMAKKPAERPRAAEIVDTLEDALAMRRSASKGRGPASSKPTAALSTSSAFPSAPSSSRRRGAGAPPSYLELFGLDTYPFNELRQPSFFWSGGPYGEAVGALASRIAAGKRPVLLLGAGGSGRTFAGEMIRQEGRMMQIYAIQPQLLPGMRSMVWLCRQIGLSVDAQSSQRSLLERFLSRALPEGLPDTVATVTVDEIDPSDADHLADMEELVDASLRTRRLAVVLVGGLDLPARLEAAGAPEALWKDTDPVVLRPLTQEEMIDYIDYRMMAIGGSRQGLPLDVACQQFLYARSRGLPRLLNVFCHNALTVAALRNEASIRVETLRLAMKSKTYLSTAAASSLLDA